MVDNQTTKPSFLERWTKVIQDAPRPERSTSDHLGRTDKDFAIEFGEYLATAAERYVEVTNQEASHYDDLADVTRGLHSAIGEFRKRAARAKEISNEPK